MEMGGMYRIWDVWTNSGFLEWVKTRSSSRQNILIVFEIAAYIRLL